nr:MFS transporter [Rathayibacter sp. VKM Ac-2857]
MRGPIIAVAPIAALLQADTQLSSAGIGLLTSLPVLLFALATPLASALIGRIGPDAATTLCLLGVVLGTVVRSAGGVPALIIGAVVIGMFITIGNVVVPVLIRRDVAPRRVAFATGLYSSAINIGSLAASLATAPLAETLGWRTALVLWAALAAVAGAVWSATVGPRAAVVPLPRPIAADRAPRVRVTGTALLLSFAFAGQAFAYYGTTAWLPQLLHDERGYSLTVAGSSSSLFQIAALIGAMGVPVLVARAGAAWGIAAVFAAWTTIPLGLLLAPDLYLLWELLGGAAQGGGFTAVFVIVVRMSTSDDHARRLSALVQGVGYAVACTAPSLVGAAHDATGGWTVPVLIIGLGVLVFGGCGLTAARLQARRAAPPAVPAPPAAPARGRGPA